MGPVLYKHGFMEHSGQRGPEAWYNEHILPLRTVNKTTPPVEEEEYYDEEMYEDEDSDFD